MKQITPNENDYIIVINNQQLYVEPEQPWQFLVKSQLHKLSIADEAFYYVGEHQSVACYVVEIQQELTEQHWLHGREILRYAPQREFALVNRALQLMTWMNQHRFCGQCGQATQAHHQESALHCSSCELFFYPRISPCMMCLVTKGDYLLLAQHQQHRNGFYATLAGFVEAGESVEQTVHREVMEEVGLKVNNLRYFKTQAWPFPHQLMIGYFAQYESGDIHIEEEEIIDAQWFHYSQLPEIPPAESLSGMMIHQFVQERRQRK